jgi:hypothetical protein
MLTDSLDKIIKLWLSFLPCTILSCFLDSSNKRTRHQSLLCKITTKPFSSLTIVSLDYSSQKVILWHSRASSTTVFQSSSDDTTLWRESSWAHYRSHITLRERTITLSFRNYRNSLSSNQCMY